MEVVEMRSAIILAAGKGTRMKSALNKVMHPVSNKPMIGHIVCSLRKVGVDNIVVVVGHGAESVREYLGDSVRYAVQEPQLGTGHAVMQAQCLSAEGGIDNVGRELLFDVPVVREDCPAFWELLRLQEQFLRADGDELGAERIAERLRTLEEEFGEGEYASE